MVFPCVNWQDRMLHGTPHGNAGSIHFNGWMTAENSVLFLIHFVKVVMCITDNKTLIIVDNHEGHISIVLKLCEIKQYNLSDHSTHYITGNPAPK